MKKKKKDCAVSFAPKERTIAGCGRTEKRNWVGVRNTEKNGKGKREKEGK
jgi:hypothetical protein